MYSEDGQRNMNGCYVIPGAGITPKPCDLGCDSSSRWKERNGPCRGQERRVSLSELELQLETRYSRDDYEVVPKGEGQAAC